jgi:hypothetical protein
MKAMSSIALALALLADSAPAFAVNPEEVAPYPASGVIIGNGWNSNEGAKTTQSCVIADTDHIEGERRTLLYQELTDTSTLLRALSVTAKAKARSIFGGSASASGSYARNINQTRENLQIFVSFNIAKGTTFLKPRVNSLGDGITAIALEPSMARLASTDPVEFRRRCGDGYVSAIERRVALDGIYSFSTRTDDERRTIRGKMSGSFKVFEASASSGEIASRMEREGKLTIQFLQDGGEGSTVPITDAAFRSLISTLGTTPGTPVPNRVVIADYRDLPNYPQAAGSALSDIGALADQYYRLAYLEDAISKIIRDEPLSQSGTMSVATARSLQDDIRTESSKIRKVIQLCITNQSACVFPAGLDRHDYRFRARMPISLGGIPNFHDYFAEIDAEYQKASLEFARTHDPNTMINVQQRVGQIRARMRIAEKDARFDYWVTQANDTRCSSDEPDVCLTNGELVKYRPLIDREPENFN